MHRSWNVQECGLEPGAAHWQEGADAVAAWFNKNISAVHTELWRSGGADDLGSSVSRKGDFRMLRMSRTWGAMVQSVRGVRTRACLKATPGAAGVVVTWWLLSISEDDTVDVFDTVEDSAE